MTVAFLLAAALQSEPLITMSGPTRRLDAVLRAVGEQAKVKIEVQGAPENDYVFLQVKDRPLSKVLDLVAQGTLSKWSEVAPGEYKVIGLKVEPDRLTSIKKWLAENPPAPVRTRANAAAFVDETLEWLQMPSEDAVWRASLTKNQKIPRLQAMAVLAHELGAEALAAIPDGERRIFRFNPTGIIEPLPPKTRQRLAQVPGEMEAIKEVLIAKGIDRDMPRGNYSDVFDALRYKTQGIEDWHVTVTASYNGLSLNCREMGPGFDSASQRSLHVGAMPDSKGEGTVFGELLKSKATFVWSPVMREILPSPQEHLTRKGALPDSPAVADRLLRCAEEELFTMGLDDVFSAIGRDQSRDVFALVPDRTFQETVLRMHEEVNRVGEPLEKVFAVGFAEQVGDDALIIREAAHSPFFRWRYPRAEAQAAFREAVEKGHVSLDASADLRLANPDAFMYTDLQYRFLYYLQRFSDLEYGSALAVFGSLSPGQRAQARNGLEISVGSLTSAQLSWVSAFLYRGAQLQSGTGRREMNASALVGPNDLRRSILRVTVKTRPGVFMSEEPREKGSLSLMGSASYGQSTYEEHLFASAPVSDVVVEVETPAGHIFGDTYNHVETPLTLEWMKYADLAAKHKLPLEPWKRDRA